METRYLTLHRLSGVIGLIGSNKIEILPMDADGTCAYVTVDKDNYLLHLRRLAALGVMNAEMFVPTSGPTVHSTPEERFERAIARVNIREPTRDEVLLVIEVARYVDQPEMEHLLDLGTFGARLRLFDTELHALAANEALSSAFAGLSLALPKHTTDTILPLGMISYAIESSSGRILYNTDIRVLSSINVQTRIDLDTAANASVMAQRLRSSTDLANVSRLLSLSSANESDQLLSFLSAWTALELFVQQVFKSTYEPQLLSLFQSVAPSSASLFVERMRAVMKDKYNIRDKFVAVASALNDAEAAEDIELFKQLKGQRDGLAHAMKGNVAELPSDATRELIRKYLKLHLNN